jgi:hypothetical protein
VRLAATIFAGGDDNEGDDCSEDPAMVQGYEAFLSILRYEVCLHAGGCQASSC